MLILTLIFTSSLISVKCDVVRKNNPIVKETRLKGELFKSLQHVSHFLAAVENKIKNERQILRDMDEHDFHYGEAEKRKDLKDYRVTYVNWQKKRPEKSVKLPTTPYFTQKTNQTQGMFEDIDPNVKKVLDQWIKDGNKQSNDNSKNTLSPPRYIKSELNKGSENLNPLMKQAVNAWVRNLSGTAPKHAVPEMIVTPIMTVKSGGLPTRNYYENYDENTEDPFGMDFDYSGANVGDFNVFATTTQTSITKPGGEHIPVTLNPFVEELKHQMVQRNTGYFTVFLTKLLDIIQTMDNEAIETFFTALRGYVFYMNSEHMLDSLGEPAISSLMSVSEKIAVLPGDLTRNYAASLVFVMVNTETFIEGDLGIMLKAADQLYEPDEGEQLFQSLEYLSIYSKEHPEESTSALVVVERMMTAAMAPLSRLAGTKKRREFVNGLNKLLSQKLPNASRRMMANKDTKKPIEFAGIRQLLGNTTENVSPRTEYIHYNSRRRMKRKKSRHHKTNKNIHKHHRHNHRKMRQILRNVLGIKKKKHHTRTHAIDTHTTHGHVKMLRATYGNPNKIVDTTSKSDLIQTKQHRYRVKSKNPVSLSLNQFRTSLNKTQNVNEYDLKNSKHNRATFVNSTGISIFTRATKDNGLLRKIVETSSYSDEENDLKVKLYRVFDTMPSKEK